MLAGIQGPQSLEKENAKIAAMRARNEARVGRFLNARQRTMGLDLDVIEAQQEERRQMQERERQAAAAEFAQQERIRMLLEERDAEERALRKDETRRRMAEWKQQVEDGSRKREAERRVTQAPIILEESGPSAVQVFRGEDPNREQRVAMQKAQMKQWVSDRNTEKERKEQAERDAAAQYHDYLMQVTDCRQMMEEEELAARKQLREETRDFNQRQAEERALREAMWRESQRNEDNNEIKHREEDLTEVFGHHFSDAGRIQRDRFKGMTHDERMQVLVDNERIHAEKLKAEEQEEQQKAAWALQEERVRRAVDRHEAERNAQAKMVKQQWQKDISHQQSVAAQKAIAMKAGRFGGIDSTTGVYAGFGRSAR